MGYLLGLILLTTVECAVEVLLKFGVHIKVKQTTNDVPMYNSLDPCEQLAKALQFENPVYVKLTSVYYFTTHINRIDGMSHKFDCDSRTSAG